MRICSGERAHELPANVERLLTALARAQAGTTEPQSLDELRRDAVKAALDPTGVRVAGGRGYDNESAGFTESSAVDSVNPCDSLSYPRMDD